MDPLGFNSNLQPQNKLLKHPKIRCFFLKEVTTKSFMKKFGKKVLSLLEVPNKKFKQKFQLLPFVTQLDPPEIGGHLKNHPPGNGSTDT